MNSTPMHIGEKIRQVRVAKGLSQENLAYATRKSKAHISRMERGDSDIDDKTLAEMKKHLEIEKAPLHNHELEVYKARIWAWSELINNRRMDNAKSMQEELSPILDLPYEYELKMLYKMIECKILLIENNTSAVKDRLNEVEAYVDKVGSDALYLYHRNKGSLFYVSLDFKNALKHYLLAHGFNDNELRPDVILLINIGNCYSTMGRHILGMEYFARAKNEYRGDQTNLLAYAIDTALASSYRVIGEFDRAITIYESALVQARGINDEHWTGQLLFNICRVNCQMGNYETAIKFSNEALPYLDDARDVVYIDFLLNRAICLKELKDYAGCDEVIKQAKAFAEKKGAFTIEAEAIRHLLTPQKDTSASYLESVALPHYISLGGWYIDRSLEICKVLESQYRKRGATRKADAIAIISRDIYKGMIYGPSDTQ